ncbi:PRD domain-containing protein [Sporosarcina sp. ANT_H38]|uniref:sigma-54-dependent transcriptional regulator n=1 Tax=Sporosarcina sp. ANT_H38 TaxID=2597358 RepID=UPI0011F17DF3|nr:sigma-54-dependent transcriptional regulator [Sporosarcina sp. ANT_H38]KAA0942123.1 PRD domain-containing protein [Sporosarcina sp. ANT_H38]
MSRKNDIFYYIEKVKSTVSANEVAEHLQLDRSNVSRYLNELHRDGLIEKTSGKPTLYFYKELSPTPKQAEPNHDAFYQLIGAEGSLRISVQQAKAAIHYPPRGLHTLILGKTGTGKSFFAKIMYNYSVESQSIEEKAPFVQFNCADYAQNPQLLFGHIFGVKKGAFTGATENRIGLIEKADKGVLFLDEIHRLSPEGQEMLFTFIDKGEFRSLGDSEVTKTASVQIIGATTESPESFLLETFTRRIPMTITLPSLEERQFEERYHLIEHFLIQESGSLNETIYVERHALTAFLLYHTTANIGQLQRDLKLACAKSFLHYISNQTSNILIRQNDLSIHVQKGLLDVKQYREKMDRLIDTEKKVFTFSHKAESNDHVDQQHEESLYQNMENKLKQLHEEGKNDKEIQTELLVDFNEYFNEYIDHLPQVGLKEMVINQILEITDKVYNFAELELNRSFKKKMKFAFALHLQRTIERIEQNNSISHPNLNKIHKKYPKEFKVAIEIAQMIGNEVGVEIPLDEIGFITMFLVPEIEENMYTQEHKVVIIVVMHGNSTASSMLTTVQDLLGVRLGKAFDMPLSMDARDMYELVKSAIHDLKPTKGVLFLVDMGSLSSFGHMIFEEMGIKTKTVSMASTPVVMEAIRKASLGRSLEDIFHSSKQLLEHQFSSSASLPKPSKKAIVTACFTGDGVAKKIKEQLQKIVKGKNIELISLQFLHRQSFTEKIEQLLEEYNILAIAGTVQFEYFNIPYFSPTEIFQDHHLKRLENVIGNHEPYSEMVEALENHFKMIPSVSRLIQLLQKTVIKLELQLGVTLDTGVDTGIILHLAFLIENMRLNQPARPFLNPEKFYQEHVDKLTIVKTTLHSLETEYDITFAGSEQMHIYKMFIENNRIST